MKALDYLRRCEGGVVISSSIGHGSFVIIEIQKPKVDIKLWIYLAEWALLEEETEVVASDMAADEFSEKRGLISILEGKRISRIDVVGSQELHILFSKKIRIEIWRDEKIYHDEDPLIRIYSKGRHVADV